MVLNGLHRPSCRSRHSPPVTQLLEPIERPERQFGRPLVSCKRGPNATEDPTPEGGGLLGKLSP